MVKIVLKKGTDRYTEVGLCNTQTKDQWGIRLLWKWLRVEKLHGKVD